MYTSSAMPHDDQNPTADFFDRLPKKLQLFLLMLVTLLGAVIEFLMGMHSVRTGKDIILNNVRITAFESFLWCGAWVLITGGLFAVFMGWAKSRGSGN